MTYLARILADRRKSAWLVIGALLATRLQTLFVAIYNLDESNYVGHALIMQHGGVPYVDFVEKKPPLIYAFYWLIFEVFGPSMPAVHAVTIVLVGLTAWLLAAQVRQALGQTHAALAALFYVVFSTAMAEYDAFGTNCEIVMNLPAAAAAWALLGARRAERPRALLALGGVFIGLAFLVKHQAGIELPIALLYLLVVRTSWRAWLADALVVGLAFLAPSLAIIAIYAALGYLPQLYEWNILTNFTYVLSGRPFGELVENGVSASLGFAAANALPLVLAVATIARRSLRARARELVALHGPWLVATCLPVAMGGHFYGHYYIEFYPPLCALAAVAGGELMLRAGELSRARRMLFVVALVAPALFFQAKSAADYRDESFEGAWSTNRTLAAAIDDNSAPSDELFVWGEYSAPYYFAHRTPATRYIVCEYVVPFWEVWLWHKDAPTDGDFKPWHRSNFQLMMQDLRAHRPRIIVDTTHSKRQLRWSALPMTVVPELADWVARDYVQIADIEGITVLRRRHQGTADVP